MNNETRNLVAAICLSMAVLIGYQMLFGKQNEVIDTKNNKNTVQESNQPSINIPKENENKKVIKDAKIFKKIPRVKILNNELNGSISLIGARFDDLTLTNYKETLDPNSKQIQFLKKINKENPFFIQFGWMTEKNDRETKVPIGDTIWKASNNLLEPGKNLILEWDNKEGVNGKLTLEGDKKLTTRRGN